MQLLLILFNRQCTRPMIGITPAQLMEVSCLVLSKLQVSLFPPVVTMFTKVLKVCR